MIAASEPRFEHPGAECEFWGDGLKTDGLLSWRVSGTLNPERANSLVGCVTDGSLISKGYPFLDRILACPHPPTHHLLIPLHRQAASKHHGQMERKDFLVAATRLKAVRLRSFIARVAGR